MTQITYKQSLACSIAFCNGTCCEIKLIIKKNKKKRVMANTAVLVFAVKEVSDERIIRCGFWHHVYQYLNCFNLYF
jgi:hypothetical protein